MSALYLLLSFCLFLFPLHFSLGAIEQASKLVTIDTLVQYGPQTIASVQERANVALYGTTVTGTTQIDGNLTTNNATIHDATINGNAYFANTTITGSLSIYGNLSLQNCQVSGQIYSFGSQVSLDNTKAQSIYFFTNKGQQTAILQNSSMLSGPLTFDSGIGIVQLYANSFIGGPITGGQYSR